MFDNKYPYTDFHEMNLDWVIKQIDDLTKKIDNLKLEWLAEANAYTDEKVANFQSQLDALNQELDGVLASVRSELLATETRVNEKITLLQAEMRIFQNKIDAEVIGINARTDEAIKQNNVYLIDELSKSVSQFKVINYFTGLSITIQEMFDYLCRFHIQNAITYTGLAEKLITYTEYVDYHMTYTDLAMRGGEIIN